MSNFLFIDVGSLRGFAKNTLSRYFGKEEVSFDLRPLVNGFSKAFYYDAFPTRNADETQDAYDARTARHRAAIDAALRVDRLHVYEGDLRTRSRKRGLEQKMVDVMLTVDMMRMAYNGSMRQATLLASDQDFAPLVTAVVNSGVEVTVRYPYGETSSDLVRAADIRRPIELQEMFTWFDEVTRSNYPLPRAENRSPLQRTPGSHLISWPQGRVECALWKDEHEWIFTAVTDRNNTLHVWAHDLELLSAYVPGCSMYFIPPDIFERAKVVAESQ